MKKIVPFVFAIFAFNFAFAQQETATQTSEEMNADRPGKGDAAKVVSQGTFQAEIGLQFENDETNFASFKTYHLPETTLRYGLLEFAELRVRAQLDHHVTDLKSNLQPENRNTDTGLNDVMVGTKLQFLKNSGFIPDAALQADFKLPVGDETLKTGKVEPKIRLNFQNKLTEGLSLNYNIGLEWEENLSFLENEKYNHIGLYTLALQYQFTESFMAFAEAYGEFEDKDMRQSFDAGVAYKLLPNLQLDAYTGFGLSEEALDLFVSAGVSFRLPD